MKALNSHFFFSDDALALRSLRAEEIGGIAAFSTRRGGCSSPPFHSLNFSVREGDSEANVRNNLNFLAKALGITSSRIVFCQQVHGEAIAELSDVPEFPPIADAMIATRPGILPAIKTADCLPILLIDPETHVCAAIHAGWKGTVRRIAGKTVRVMEEKYGVNPAKVFAALGPAIGPCCYEVGEAVLEPFRQNIPGADAFIIHQKNRNERKEREGAPIQPSLAGSERYHIDLANANKSDLMSEGILPSNIHATNLCTACNPQLFFSYRREQGKTGRQMAVTGFPG